MITLFRKKRTIDTSLTPEQVIEQLNDLKNTYVTDNKYLEVDSKGTRTFGLYFHKNVPAPQFNYSVSKEIWIETITTGARLHIKTRPITFIWLLPFLMLPMFPSAIHEWGAKAVLIFILPILALDVLFIAKSITENSLLDMLIDGAIKK